MPKPVLQAMVLADHVYQDRLTGKFIIAGTFSQIISGTVKMIDRGAENNPDGAGNPQVTSSFMRAGSPYLYLALFEVYGQVPLVLKFVDLSDASVLFEGQFVVTSVDALAVAEYAVPIPPLPVAKVGEYSLDLMYDGEILGSWRVGARKAEDSSNGDQDHE